MLVSLPFQSRCRKSRWTEVELPGDYRGQEGLVGHSGKGGAAQSFPYPKGTSELRSCEKTVMQSAYICTAKHCVCAHTYTRSIHTGNQDTNTKADILYKLNTNPHFHIFFCTSLSFVLRPQFKHVPQTLPSTHTHSPSFLPHSQHRQQSWVVASLCHPLFPGRSTLKIHLCSSTSKERL